LAFLGFLPDNRPMFAPLRRVGGIVDLALGLRWDSPTLGGEVARRASALVRNKIGPGSLVVIAHEGTARFFADLLAAWNLGATAVCIDPGITEAEFATLIDFVKPTVILVDGEVPVTAGSRVLRLANDQDGAPVASAWRAEDPALVLFTSGTTGAPKGVVLSFGALIARWSLNLEVIGQRALARTLVTLPTHFGHGLIGNALTPLLSGGTIVLCARGISPAKNLARLIGEHEITFLSSVPALWRVALKMSNPPSGNTLQRVHIGSAPLSAALWSDVVAWSRAEVVNCYGLTETANWVAGASSKRGGIEDDLLGSMWGGAAAIAREDGSIKESGEGEILLRTPSLMTGYFQRPDLTADVLRDGWLHTGDRGRIDPRGTIRITGRIKDEINRAGFKVQPAEIDRLLESHPAVAQACTFAVSDSVSGETVAIAIRLADGATETADSLRAWCATRLRREAIPERWFFVAELPNDARGKIARDAVRRMVLEDARA
jgi:oxalate---CoA ligase